MVLLKRLGLIGVSAGALCAQSTSFGSGLYAVMEKANCRACHTVDGVASATRLHMPETDATPAMVEAFGKSLVVLVDRKNPEASLLLRKPTARVAHAGGEKIKPGSEDEAVLKAWIGQLARLSESELDAAMHFREQEDKGSGAASQDAELRRLTHSQYNHTVRDLLGDQTAPSNQFPPEDFINGFRNQSRGQSLSPLLVEAYSSVAERLARSAFQGGDTHGLVPCKPSAACRARFVREFGLKAFRREAFLRLPYFDHIHRYLPAQMIREGYKVAFEPVNHRPRTTGASKYTNLQRLWAAFSDLQGVMWLNTRSRRPEPVSEI